MTVLCTVKQFVHVVVWIFNKAGLDETQNAVFQSNPNVCTMINNKHAAVLYTTRSWDIHLPEDYGCIDCLFVAGS